jgi:hypothetical protein
LSDYSLDHIEVELKSKYLMTRDTLTLGYGRSENLGTEIPTGSPRFFARIVPSRGMNLLVAWWSIPPSAVMTRSQFLIKSSMQKYLMATSNIGSKEPKRG